MSKRNSDGDVIANRLSLVEAKGQRFLASLLGPQTEPGQSSDSAKTHNEDEDLKEVFGHDRLGVGGILPKGIEDGSFTKRIPTSNDKLLAQLIGNKRAKAHIAAKQEAARPNARAQPQGKAAPVKREESEDEEEGRAAAFKSKRRKGNRVAKRYEKSDEEENEDDNEDEESRTKRLEARNSASNEMFKEATADVPIKDEQPEADDEAGPTNSNKKGPIRGKTKPKSFLDEILAERSKKKQNKKKS